MENKSKGSKAKILLGLMPFWDALIPPTGICCLKNYLQKNGYPVKTLDPNTEKPFKGAYNNYFDTLKQVIPAEQRGNFLNVGHDVLRNQMMAYLHRDGEGENHYLDTVRLVIEKHYFFQATNDQIHLLTTRLDEYCAVLETYLVNQLETEKPSVFGLTVYTGTLPSSLFAFRLVKEKYPHIATVMGGGIFAEHLLVNSSNLDFFLEKTPYIDKIIIGQGEELFLEYLEEYLEKGPDAAERMSIHEIEIKDPENPGPYSLEVPDYSDFNTRKYPYLAVSGSVSCPHECSFCNYRVFWGPYRRKQTDLVVAEMQRLYDLHQCQLFYFTDAIVNPYIDEFSAKIIESPSTFYYDGFLKVDELTCDYAHPLQWRRGGFYRARLGIESGSQRVLDLMEKPVTVEQIRVSLANLARAGIKTTCFFIMGHPGETEEDFQQTLDLLEELKDYIYEAESAPFMYFYSAQNSGGDWLSEFKNLRMFPEHTRDSLLIDTWLLDCEPSRNEMFRRFWRFTEHIKKIGIPNPYSMYDILNADMRWKSLHPNAAPMLVEFQDRSNYITECKKIEK